MDEVSRGSVGLSPSRFDIKVMNLSGELIRPLRGHCFVVGYDIKLVREDSYHRSLHHEVFNDTPFPLSIEIGDLRAFPPAVFTNKWVVDQCITDTQFETLPLSRWE